MTSAAAAGMLAFLLTGCVIVGTDAPTRPDAGTAPAPQSPPESGATGEQQMARAIFDRVNGEREHRGLEPVSWNDDLAKVARDWSSEMAEAERLEHQDVRELLQRESLSGFTSIGENIFRANRPVPAGVIHAGWMRSDGHRANVLNPGWNRLGIGVFCAPDGSVWATQEFGRTTDADRPPVSRETPPEEPIVHDERDGPTCG